MIRVNGFNIIINDVRQTLHYFVLPNNISDSLLIDLPELIQEEIAKWINGKTCDLFLDALNKKYTFRDSKVTRQVIGNNRYGERSRNLVISFESMILGFHRRK